MKKLLIGLTILFSFILFLDNVNASVINGTYTINEDILNSDLYYNDFLTDYYGHTTSYDYLISSGKLDSFHEAIMNNGYKYYFYDNDSLKVWNDDSVIIGFSLTDDTGYSNSGYSLKGELFNPNNSLIVSYSYKDWVNSNKLSPLNYTSTRISATLGRHKRSASSDTTYNGFNTVSYTNNGLTYYHFQGFNTNKDVIFTASLPIEYGSTKNYYQSININGTPYNDGDIIYSPTPQIYQYNEEIDTTNLSYIRVDFDTTGTTYEDYNFINIENVTSSFKEAYIETSWDYGVCVDVDHCYEKYIHRNNLNYLSTQNNYYMLSKFKYEDIEHGFYDETQELDYYYLYIDVSNSTDVIDFLIESTVNFSVNFGYLEDYENTFTKINLKNYSGILLYPKSNVYNGNYIFYLDNANINILEYNNDKIVNKYENIFLPTVEIEKMEYYMLNRFYLIENNKVNEDSYISFDNKYFIYKLIENSSDSIVIKNPNTNKDEYIDSINNSNLIYESQKEYENIFDMINQGQIDNSIINIFTNVYNEFRKGMLGIYIFTIIAFSIILLLLKSAKR